MARILVQLKIRLLRNALRSSGRAKVSFIVSSTFAVLVAVGTFTTLALLRGPSAVAQSAAVFTVFAFGWLILPIMTFGLDSTLDPAALVLYPVRTRPLAVVLLAASATGAWPFANVIGLLGVTIGLARGPLGVVIALLAVLLQVLFCIALARFVTTSMADVLRSRRGKDLAGLLVVPIFALYEFFAQVVPRLAAEGKITAEMFAGIDRWLRWLPPGLAAHAIQDASTGHLGLAMLRLALLAAVIVVLSALWIRSLSRALVTVDTSTQSSAVRGVPLPFAWAGIRGTVAGRYLIDQRRDPGSIARWCIMAVAMAAASISTIRTPAYHVALALSAIIGAGMLSLFNSNTIGFAGASFQLEATALSGTRALRAYFAGRNMALAVIAVPLLVVMSFLLAAIAGHPADGFWATGIDLAGVGAGLALSSIYTVSLAYPGQKRVGSPVPGPADGYGGQAFVCAFGSLLGVAAVTLPVTLALAFTQSAAASVALPILVLFGAGYGIALAWAGVRIAAAIAERRLPELCQIAISSKL